MKKIHRSMIRDLAVLILLLYSFGCAMLMTVVPSEGQLMLVGMMLLIDIAVLIGFFGHISLCTVLSGIISCTWIGYRLYRFYVGGEIIAWYDYAMIPMPFVAALSAWLFHRGLRTIDAENQMLRRQVEELVLVDEATGLYNLRALYRDLIMMVKYCNRNNLPLCLMIVQMRYEQELSAMLPRRQYIELRQRMSMRIHDNLRLEDRMYCIDERGTIAILLTTDVEHSDLVHNRLRDRVPMPEAYKGILEDGTQLDLRFACKQYDESYGNDMMRFKQAVESELVYDV